jgi:signal transduction histidine kinase
MCRLRRRTERGEQPLELDVWCAPIEVAGQRFVLLSALDASDRIHREYLERSVIGQVAALASEIDFLATNLARAGVADRKEAMAVIAAAAKRLTTLAHAHEELTAAERGELSPAILQVSSLAILRSAVEDIASHPAALLRSVQIDPASDDAAFTTDPALVGKVLAHMLSNALEASPERASVTAGCLRSAGGLEFWVHNDGEMSRAVQLQLFQRSFSTKGPGRGFGTYLMRMLTERYLRGTVSFRSTQSEGTTFLARFPVPAGENRAGG